MGLLAEVAAEMGAKAGLLSPEELAERRMASEVILGLIDALDVESIVGGDPDELWQRMTGLEIPPSHRPTIWPPPGGIWMTVAEVRGSTDCAVPVGEASRTSWPALRHPDPAPRL